MHLDFFFFQSTYKVMGFSVAFSCITVIYIPFPSVLTGPLSCNAFFLFSWQMYSHVFFLYTPSLEILLCHDPFFHFHAVHIDTLINFEFLFNIVSLNQDYNFYNNSKRKKTQNKNQTQQITCKSVLQQHLIVPCTQQVLSSYLYACMNE